jgi:hypothetical protein
VQFIYHGDCMEFVVRGHMQGDLSGVSLECGVYAGNLFVRANFGFVLLCMYDEGLSMLA